MAETRQDRRKGLNFSEGTVQEDSTGQDRGQKNRTNYEDRTGQNWSTSQCNSCGGVAANLINQQELCLCKFSNECRIFSKICKCEKGLKSCNSALPKSPNCRGKEV